MTDVVIVHVEGFYLERVRGGISGHILLYVNAGGQQGGSIIVDVSHVNYNRTRACTTVWYTCSKREKVRL